MTPPPPQVWPAGQDPQSIVPPQPSGTDPHMASSCTHVLGEHGPPSESWLDASVELETDELSLPHEDKDVMRPASSAPSTAIWTSVGLSKCSSHGWVRMVEPGPANMHAG